MIKSDFASINPTLLVETQTKPPVARDLAEAADQFESIFVSQILKQSRQTKLADTPFDSSAGDSYQSMLDDEYASMLSSKVNLGIAEALVRQFGRHVD